MSYTVDAITTDTYQELACPGTVRVTVQVSNAAVLLGFGHGRGTAHVYDQADEPFLPVVGALDRDCDAVRFKSYAPGKPGRLMLTAIPGPPA